jgi:hypothetical protein
VRFRLRGDFWRQKRKPHCGALLGGVNLVIEHTGGCFESAQRGTRVRGSGVCTEVNGIVPLTGRRTHLGLHHKYIVSITSCRKAH